jgi:hypothetical protein
MSAVGLDEVLRARGYPGRGVLIARTITGNRCLAYFLTGRSSASLQRELAVGVTGDVEVRDLQTQRERDELRHYAAVARVAWTASGLAAGEGVLMTTDDSTANHVSAARTPVDVTIAAETADELLGELWAALDPELRVAAVAFDPATFPADIQIVGRH